MISLAQVEGFEWDDGNTLKSLFKHGVSKREAEEVFLNEPLLLEDEKHSGAERRMHAFGETHLGQLLHVSFTLRGEGSLIRVISARPMNRKERRRYAEEA
jgi:uncharacterized DUF497 family protein